MSEFKYLGNTVINKNCVQEERKNKLNQGIHATIQFKIFLLSYVLHRSVQIIL